MIKITLKTEIGKLVYKKEYENKTEALKREKWFKTGAGREYLQKIINGS